MFWKRSILSDAEETTEGLKIVYDDVAPYAKENSNPQVVDPGLRPRVGLHPRKGLYPRATTVRQELPDLKRDDITYPGYALCLPGFALLNGEYVNFPDEPGGYGFISDEISDENGNFKYTIREDGLRPRIGLHPQMFLFPRTSTKIKTIKPQPQNTRKVIRYSPTPDGSNMTESRQPNSQYIGVGYMPKDVYDYENLQKGTKDFSSFNTPVGFSKLTEIHEGTTVLRRDSTTSGYSSCEAQLPNLIEAQYNEYYTISFYAKVDSIANLSTGFCIFLALRDENNKPTSVLNSKVLKSLIQSSGGTDGNWIKLTFGGLDTSQISKYIVPIFRQVGNATGTNVYISSLKIEKGNNNTPWTLAPSDWLSDPGNYEWIPIAEYGKYIDAPSLTVTFNQKFTSVGLLLTFNTLSGDYANHINVQWYGDNELISSMDFTPDDTKYFCSNYVMFYDKIVITFLSTSKPHRPVFITRIDYGIYREFLSDEVRSISCLQEINAISENLSVNTMNFTARTKSSVPFDLQKKQKLSLYFNGGLIGCFYLKNGARKSQTDYYMDSHDALGVLDGNEYHGGIYTGQMVPDVIADIFDGEDFNYLLADAFDSVQLHGYIPYTTKRNALVQIAFAIGAVVDTSNYDGVLIYPKEEEKTGEFTEVFDGLTLEHSDVVTGVRLTVHDYQQSTETAEIYKGALNGTALVTFSEPYHGLSITGGTINSSGDNYAYITGTGGEVVLTGAKYNHYTSTVVKENPNIIYNKNIKEVTDATLVYSGNAQEALERVYEYYQRAENVVGDVLLGDKLIGQVVDIDSGYDGVKTGTIESVSYSFAGSIKAEVIIHE